MICIFIGLMKGRKNVAYAREVKRVLSYFLPIRFLFLSISIPVFGRVRTCVFPLWLLWKYWVFSCAFLASTHFCPTNHPVSLFRYRVFLFAITFVFINFFVIATCTFYRCRFEFLVQLHIKSRMVECAYWLSSPGSVTRILVKTMII